MATADVASDGPVAGDEHRRAWHWWFLLFAGVAGAALVLLVPVGKPPDEVTHLDRIWTISEGRVVPDIEADGSAGGAVSQCVDRYEREILPLYVTVPPLDLGTVLGVDAACSDGGPEVVHEFGNTAINSPVTYAPQVVAVAGLRAAGAPVRTVVYGARFAALAGYLALVAFSLWIAPGGRRWLFVVGALPAALGLASSLSSDTLVLGLALVVVALVIRLRTPGPHPVGSDRLARVALAGALLALALAKNSNALFLLLWLLVPPPAGVEGGRRLLARLWVPVAGLALSAAWALQVRGVSKFPPSEVFPGVDPQAQLSWALHHPFDLLGVLGATLGSTELFGGILPRVVGRYPSGRPNASGAVLSPPVPLWMLGLIVGALGAALWVELGRRRGTPARAATWLVALVGLGAALLTMLLVYAVSTPVGGPRILLFQGRYFTPLLPLVALVASLHRAPRPSGDRLVTTIDRALLVAVPVILVGELFVTYTMYYR